MTVWREVVDTAQLSRHLPFHAWPLQWRLGAWVLLALSSSVILYALTGWSGGVEHTADAPQDEAGALASVLEAEQRLAALPALRQRASLLADAEVPDTPDTPDTLRDGVAASGPHVSSNRSARVSVGFAAATSSAALLAWTEQLVQASQVRLIAFEPVSDAATDAHRDPAVAGAVDRGGDAQGARDRDDHAPLLSQRARLSVEGRYPKIIDFVERVARTDPALLMQAATLRASGPTLTLDMHVGVAGTGRFRLAAASTRFPAVIGDRSGPTANPFARRSLPDATVAARLLGTLVRAGRRAALLSIGKEVSLVEAGQTFGDARVEHVARDAVTLLPFTGGASRVLTLREAQR